MRFVDVVEQQKDSKEGRTKEAYQRREDFD